MTGKGEMLPFDVPSLPDADTGAPPASMSANGQFDRDRDRTPDKALRDREIRAEQLSDFGGRAPLDWDDDRQVLRSASDILRILSAEEMDGDRNARMLLLSGFLLGMSLRGR